MGLIRPLYILATFENARTQGGHLDPHGQRAQHHLSPTEGRRSQKTQTGVTAIGMHGIFSGNKACERAAAAMRMLEYVDRAPDVFATRLNVVLGRR